MRKDLLAPRRLTLGLALSLALALSLVACDGAGGGVDASTAVDAAAGRDAATGRDAAAVGDGGEALDPCAPIGGAAYRSVARVGPVTDRPPAEHADLNLKLRGWGETGGELGIIEVGGPTDELAPKLFTLFSPNRVPVFSTNYAVNNWDWGTNMRAGPITESEVTLAGFEVEPGEVLELPRSGYMIAEGLGAMVLYADEDSITLKYTPEDNVVRGYTVHVVGLCVEPSLRALYEASDAAGRVELPALGVEQPFGRARGREIQVSIRDTGAFMDPRVRKDWW